MSKYDVVPGNVAWAAQKVVQALDGGNFNHGEVILGVAEALGRIVVNIAETPVQGGQCLQVIVNHLNETMQAGFTAKGFNMGGDDHG